MSDLYTHLPFSGSNTALVTPFTPDGGFYEVPLKNWLTGKLNKARMV